MSSDDYQVQNVYRYSRKTYKKNRRNTNENDFGGNQENMNIETAETSPRSDFRTDGNAMESPGCSCDDPEAEIAHILHKKCPVITLAQQQLQRLLDETDRLLCDNTRCCRSVYDFLCICKEVFSSPNRYQYALILLIFLAFFLGLVFGAASCGSYLGRFNSPILFCIDNYFRPDSYASIEDSYRSIF